MTALTLIAAVGKNGVIGKDGGLAWSHPADMKHFRETTAGAPVIMGRKTWDSLPAKYRPLPGRWNIVVTRDWAGEKAGATRVNSPLAAMEVVQASGKPIAYVIGGGELYAALIGSAEILVLTEVDDDLEGDTFFPHFDKSKWTEVFRAPHDGFSIVRYAKKY